MKTLLLEWYGYNHEANALYISRIVAATVQNPRVPELMAHILNAHATWVNRIQGKTLFPVQIWQQQPADVWAGLNDELLVQTKVCLESEQFGPAYEKLLVYHDSKGNRFENRLIDIHFHTLNHSNYHRAQLAVHLKAEGVVPPMSDYILYKRNGDSLVF